MIDIKRIEEITCGLDNIMKRSLINKNQLKDGGY